MKLLPIFLLIFLFGCLGPAPQPLPNITESAEGWSRYNGFVEFEFPSGMKISHKVDEYNLGRGTASVSGQCPIEAEASMDVENDVSFSSMIANFSGSRHHRTLRRSIGSVSGVQCPGNGKQETGNRTPTTLFALGFSNTTLFGQIDESDPGKTVEEFLSKDSLSDPIGMLSNAKDVSEMAQYRSGDAYVAEVVFSLEVLGPDGESKLSGYAIDLYYPEKSALYRYRVLSENANYSTDMKERFMQSFEG